MIEWFRLLAGFGWRDWMLMLIVLTAIYMAVVFLRLQRVGRVAEEVAAQHLSAARYDADLNGVKEPSSPVVTSRREPVAAYASEARSERKADRPRGIESVADEYVRDPVAALARANADRAAIERLQREMSQVKQLREEIDTLRTTFSSLREELYQELAQLRVSQQISPLYGDSMQMALAGASPEDISDRCGIARAEAELVAALARSREDDQSGGFFDSARASRGGDAWEGGQIDRPKRFGSY